MESESEELRVAFKSRDRAGIEQLLQRSVNIDANIAEHGGRLTMLHAAIQKDDLEMVEWLLAHGANIEAAAHPWRGTTALHLAARRGNCEAIRLLVSRGANIEAYDLEESGTPLDIAITEDNAQAARLLLELGASISQGNAGPSRPATLHGAILLAPLDLDLLKTIVTAGADVNQLDGDEAPLHTAVEVGAVEAVRFLLQQGANPNAPGKWSPMRTACDTNNGDIVQILLAHGANVPEGYENTVARLANRDSREGPAK